MHWIDPAQLPLQEGIIERFTINGQGELDGLLLKTNAGEVKLVHFPSHMAHEVSKALRRGDWVGVRGVRPRDAELIAAIALESAAGIEIQDHGPPRHSIPAKSEPKFLPMSADGQVRLTLFTPKGKVRGAILEDGTIVRLKLKEAEEIRHRLRPGARIYVQGTGLDTEHGRVIEVHTVGTPPGQFEVRTTSRTGPPHDRRKPGQGAAKPGTKPPS